MRYLFLIIFIIQIQFACGQKEIAFINNFKKLLEISKKDSISIEDLNRSIKLKEIILQCNNVIYFDSIKERKFYIPTDLAKPFADICFIAGTQGVEAYINYVIENLGSANEEISLFFERIFMKYPETTLQQIGTDQDLLDKLIWGFINNRYYGAVNPYENNDYRAITKYEDEPQPILNKNNCEKIFFETNPILQDLYPKYKEQIDYILKGAKDQLNFE